jgi:signal transduction histidine kinase
MRHSASLRSRIVRACVVLALVLCSVYAVIVFFSVKAIEGKLVNDRLAEAADQLIENHLRGFKSGVPGDPEVFAESQMPAAVRALGPGVHEVMVEGRSLHILFRDHGGQRFAVVDDESDFEHMEVQVWAVLGGACALCVGLAFFLGRATASRVLEPVVSLAERVKAGRLDGDLPAINAADEVGVLARALAAHHLAMQRFLSREQLFTGDVSHELRTPLTVILGASELLAARLAGRPDLMPVVERIRRTAVETADRVGALLLLSRAPQTLDFPLVELVPALEHELDRARPLLEGKPVTLELRIEHPAHVFGRPELISIALGNLIRNACQFTEEGHVRVTLRHDHLLVEDTGAGIPDAVKARIFERFVRASTQVPGTGLGLAIVQRVCEHLGWTVTAEKPEHRGSRFVVRFAKAPPKKLPAGIAEMG